MFDIVRICLFIGTLLVIAYFDMKRGIIPNKIVYPAIVVTAVLNTISGEVSLLNSFIGGCGLAVFFIVTALVLKNMGMGDVKLGFLMGLMTGFPEGLIALVCGVFLGGLIAIGLVVFRIKDKKSSMPYGPYLAAGAIFTIIGMQFALFGFLYNL